MSAPTRAARLALAFVTAVGGGALIPASPAAAAREHTMAAAFLAYVPESITISEGDSIVFVNTDPLGGAGHTVTQATHNAEPRFDSDVATFGESVEVRGVAELARGEYMMYCRIHPFMTASLFVGGQPRSPSDRISDLLLR